MNDVTVCFLYRVFERLPRDITPVHLNWSDPTVGLKGGGGGRSRVWAWCNSGNIINILFRAAQVTSIGAANLGFILCFFGAVDYGLVPGLCSYT